MKYFTYLFFLTIISINGYSQIESASAEKPPLPMGLERKWPSVGSGKISDDGKYVAYSVGNVPAGHVYLVVYSVSTGKEIRIENSDEYWAKFMAGSRKLLFKKGKDSLGILDIERGTFSYWPKILSFDVLGDPLNRYFIYYKAGEQSIFNICDVITGRLTSFSSIRNYWYFKKTNSLLLEKDTSFDGSTVQTLNEVNLDDGNKKQIWRGVMEEGTIMDARNAAVAFLSKKEYGSDLALLYYKSTMDKPVQISDGHALKMDDNSMFDRLATFSKDGKNIYYTVKRRQSPALAKTGIDINVWSYTDEQLQSFQQEENKYKEASHPAIINISTKKVTSLFEEGDKLYYQPDNNDYLLIPNWEGDPAEAYWNKTSVSSVFLTSLKSGERKLISRSEGRWYRLSNDEKYVVFYDVAKKDYFSYEISTGVTRNITRGINADWARRNDEPDSGSITYPIAGFTDGDSSVLLYDQNDLFEADPSGRRDPINVTGGFGKAHNICFRLLFTIPEVSIPANKQLYLNAFDKGTKENGFYSIQLGVSQIPNKLSMSPYFFAGTEEDTRVRGFLPLKANKADVFLVKRENSSEFPNIFWTRDFRSFTRVSGVFPERNYNWYTTQLVQWKTYDGFLSQGLLYKPENFDSSKRYPVIFFYYERNSAGLHGYLKPEDSEGPLNIPWYVSNGYIVFVPDIYYRTGYPGRSAFNSIVSAAEYLKGFKWVDSTRLGLQGHSFGGFETNYVITHTNLFRAACSASGMTDFVSSYGSIIGDGSSRARQYEVGRDRIGAPLSERPDLYIENSPVLRADKVETPLLMMANKDDGDVPYQQGIELFTALRRYGKKVWLLQYGGEGHILLNDDSKTDFSIRMSQFFDYYLKDIPAPVWMTKGIPEKEKGVDTGLNIDPAKTTPGPGLLIQ